MKTANVILAQLGGNRFLAMTGAKNLLGDDAGLQFRLPRGAKDGINSVRITIEADDTYTITFFKIGRAPSFAAAEIAKVSMVYTDSVRRVFESATGLYTSLGTLGAA